MGKNWYALKVFFNKVFEAEAGLEEMGIETYFPVSLKEVKGDEFFRIKKRLSTPDSSRNDNKFICEGPRIFKRAPVVNSLVFFRTEPKNVSSVSEMIRGRGFVYMNAERQKPAIIPDRQMEMFRMVSTRLGSVFQTFHGSHSVMYLFPIRARVIASF